LGDSARSSLLANVGTLVTYRAGSDEAHRLARELAPVSPADIMGLPRFEVAARLSTGLGNAVTVVTGRTEGPPPKTGQGATIRRLSAERYGRDPREVETELRDGYEGNDSRDEGPLGRARRLQ